MKRSRLSVSSSEDEDSDFSPTSAAKRPPPHWKDQDKGGSSSSPTSSSSMPSFRPVKEKEQTSFIDSRAEKMMAKMGYKSGTGLGKHSQGRVAPVELSTQRGRRGLGLRLEGLEPANLEWDSSHEIVEIEEQVKWLIEDAHVPISLAQLKAWMKEGPRKMELEGEHEFCDENVLKNVISSKSVFDQLDKHELMKARTRSNPFETIGRGFFLNRAAMKMANMDAVFDFMFTKPVKQDNHPMLGPNDLLYFADVCAGPGGFSEYVLWRKGWEAKGFGMTLRDSNDFRLEDFHAAPCETFEPYYGPKGDGNVYDPENVKDFEAFVLDNTQGYGVHFMMADGGFSVDGQENIQEILSKQLYLCQCLVALSIVRIEGHFVVKLFDLFTPFSVGLIYLMHKCFHQISIHKPNTSRPANSERYLVCKWKREDTSSIKDYLFEVNLKLNRQKSHSKQDIMELVPVSVLKEDDQFYDFIVESNNILGERQIINLIKIRSFCQDFNLLETRQSEMKRKCLEFWQVPDKNRTAPKLKNPDEKARELLKLANTVGFIKTPQQDMTPAVLNSSTFSVYDWKCLVIASNNDNKNNATFFLGLGRGHVYFWEKVRNCWQKCTIPIELSADTLIYGEIAQELKGERSRQVKIPVLHIIDAAYLGGIDISGKHLNVRHDWCRKYELAINKPSKPELMRITVKELFRLEELDNLFSRLEYKGIKAFSGNSRLSFMLQGRDERFFLPGGLMFLRITKDPWMMVLSRKQQRKYWFNRSTNASTFSFPPDCMEKFDSSYSKRIIWWWDEGVSLHLDESAPSDSDKVHRATIMDRVQNLLSK